MPVLITRNRMLAVRLSGDEYAALEKFCVESGARSISDLARNAICSFLNQPNRESALLASVNQNSAHVKELEERLGLLARELAAMKAGMPAHDAAGGRVDRSEKRNLASVRRKQNAGAHDLAVDRSNESLPEDVNDSDLNVKI